MATAIDYNYRTRETSELETPFFIVPEEKLEIPVFVEGFEYEEKKNFNNSHSNETPMWIPYSNKEYSFDENAQKLRNREKDRNEILNRLYSPNERLAKSTANSMINHLLRYEMEEKTLSREGYKTIQQNWKLIKENMDEISREDQGKLEVYLRGEYTRIKKDEVKIIDKEVESKIPSKTSLWNRIKKSVTSSRTYIPKFSFGRA
ncbi:hypothetical protein COU53_02055 [Candidatus Pacearchaeota archaeon CG10_big_fil_rev_8_21_14_0_10_30_48]|nr:MAG: hypothetical protein COU53_02055 [Candidatus Pacearchaeota archaeon CG10_big_fil_rev_8_21_14_0_10_30_48]